MTVPFDFSRTIEDTVDSWQSVGFVPLVAALPQLLDKRTMRDYAALYFAQDFSGDMNNVLNTNPSPVPGFLDAVYDHHVPESGLKGPRMSNQYLLSARQTSEAYEFYRDTPILGQTVAALQAMLRSYFSDLREAVAAHSGEASSVFQAVDDAHKLSSIFSFMHDLMPVMAYSLVKDGHIVGNDTITAQEYQRSLTLSFRSKAWETTTKGWPGGGYTTRCPFRKNIGPLFSTVLEKMPDGSIHVDHDREIPGALPVFVAGRIKELNIPPLDDIYQPNPG